MLKFDRAKFYAGFREFEDELTQQQVNGVNFILDSMEKDPFLKKIEHAAYMFATVKPETAHTYQPIHEYGGYKYFVKRYGSQTKVGRGLGNDTPEEGAIYAGRGDVQLTGEDNYEKAEAALRKYYPEIVKEFEQRTGKKFDLTVGDQPNDAGDADNASDPAIAYAIMSFGMHTGMFTGRSLKSHTTAAGFDAYNARDIINADKKKNGRMIEGYYNKFLAILRASKISAAAAPMPVVAQLDETGHDPDLTSPTPDAQASPDVESTQTPTIENTINSEGDTTLLNKVDAAGNKWTAITATLEKFGIAIPDAKTSLGTWFMTGFKLLFSAIMAALGVVYDHWEYFLLAAVLLYLAYRLYNRSRDRVAQEKAGIPVELLKETK